MSQLPPYHKRILRFFVLFLIILFTLIGIGGVIILRYLNTERIEKIDKEIKTMLILNEISSAFSKQHNAITYGISKSVSSAKEIYETSQAEIQKNLTLLKSQLYDRKDFIMLNMLNYNQAMFSDQIIKLFDYLIRRKTLSLTYDELTDLKAYPVNALNEANRYAENFKTAISQLQESSLERFKIHLSFIFKIFRKGILYFTITLATILLLLLTGLWLYSKASAKPFEKVSAALKVIVESDFKVMPDYGIIDDENVKFVLKSICEVISHFRNFLNSIKTDIIELSTFYKNLPSSLRVIIKESEKSIKDIKEIPAILLPFVQEFDNSRFYLEKISNIASGLYCEREKLVSIITPVYNLIEKVISSNRQLTETLYKFNEDTEKIDSLALNINLEAAKENEPKGYGELASEIRNLMSSAIYSHKKIVEIINSNLKEFADIKTTLKETEEVFKNINLSLKDLNENGEKLSSIAKNGIQVTLKLEQIIGSVSNSSEKATNIIKDLEEKGKILNSVLNRLLEETTTFSSIKKLKERSTSEEFAIQEKL